MRNNRTRLLSAFPGATRRDNVSNAVLATTRRSELDNDSLNIFHTACCSCMLLN